MDHGFTSETASSGELRRPWRRPKLSTRVRGVYRRPTKLAANNSSKTSAPPRGLGYISQRELTGRTIAQM
jgi:hypothetical protein